MKKQKTLYIDLDGTLNQYSGWKGSDHFPPLREGAREFLQALKQNGFKMKLFTTRAITDSMLVWAWLRQERLDTFFQEVTARKGMDGYLFVDDRNIAFTGDYQTALQQIIDYQPHWRQ